MPRITRSLMFIAVLIPMTAAACSSSAKSSTGAVTTTTVNAQANDPVYARPGPYKVGMTTLRLPDRDVIVWYPADPAAVAGKPKATYSQTTPLPANLRAIVPAQYNTVVTMDAYTGVPASAKGPFPVVLFSHGAGAYDLVNSGLDVGIASWGLVVASTDYKERGLAAQLAGASRNTAQPSRAEEIADAARDKRIMLATLDLVIAESARTDSVLHGAVDGHHVAAVGHSAGGGTAFDALSDPRVQVAVGWAPVGPVGPPAQKPTMIIGATGDSALTPSELTKLYASFAVPKRFVEIGPAGHNTFTDICVVIRNGGGLVSFAAKNHLVAPDLLSLATNGCDKSNLSPQQFWPAVQHFTVAEIRSVFGIDDHPVGLGDGIASAFPGVTITYRHQP